MYTNPTAYTCVDPEFSYVGISGTTTQTTYQVTCPGVLSGLHTCTENTCRCCKVFKPANYTPNEGFIWEYDWFCTTWNDKTEDAKLT